MKSAMLATVYGLSFMISLAAAIAGTKINDKLKDSDNPFSGNVTVLQQKQAVSYLKLRLGDRQSLICKTPGLKSSTSSCNLYHLFCAKEDDNQDTFVQVSDVRSSVTEECVSAAIGNVITKKSAGPAKLTCTTRISKGAGRKVSVSCREDEELTDCSSKIESRGRNNGVKVVMEGNVRTCQIDSVGSTRYVPKRLRPIARCCKHPRMQCQHITDGPTGKRKGDTAKSKCDKPFHVLGCSAFMVDGWMDGTRIISNSCRASVGFQSKTGIYSFATCCIAPGLSCAVYHDSPRIRNRLMKKKCPRGSILTGCSGYQGRAQLQGGSYIKDIHGTPTCHVEGDYKTTLVYYICCRSLKVY